MNVDDVLVEIGGTNTMKEFSDNLRGAKAGEARSFDVTYPEDFSDKRLAGKTVHYEVQIKSIKRKSTPELTDDFAKEVGSEFESLENLKLRIRESIQAGKQQEEEHRAKDKLVQDLVTKFDIAVPESMVEQQIDTRLERGLRALAAQGMRSRRPEAAWTWAVCVKASGRLHAGKFRHLYCSIRLPTWKRSRSAMKSWTRRSHRSPSRCSRRQRPSVNGWKRTARSTAYGRGSGTTRP